MGRRRPIQKRALSEEVCTQFAVCGDTPWRDFLHANLCLGSGLRVMLETLYQKMHMYTAPNIDDGAKTEPEPKSRFGERTRLCCATTLAGRMDPNDRNAEKKEKHLYGVRLMNLSQKLLSSRTIEHNENGPLKKQAFYTSFIHCLRQNCKSRNLCLLS